MILSLAAVGVYRDGRTDLPDEISGRAEARDGDSLVVGGRRVRLKGIDAPELGQTCRAKGAEWDCGRRARKHLAALAGRGTVRCKVRDRDRFGRLLAHCTAAGRDLNRQMVRDGLAVAFGEYRRDEADARAQRRGLWAGTFERPSKWRKRNPR